MDVIQRTQELVRLPSVTPEGSSCLDLIAEWLKEAGFTCSRLPSGNVDNLYASWGEGEPHVCFAGHVDVVPPGDLMRWTMPPFEGCIKEGNLYGRGTVDMKGAIAAFISAALNWIKNPPSEVSGNGLFSPVKAISFLLTTDEEGPAIDGTKTVVSWLKERGHSIDFCLVGEPTNPRRVGDMIKIGRRGSLNGHLSIDGVGGHVAYPDLARNPIPEMMSFLQALLSWRLDEGAPHFDPSHLEITSIDVGNPTHNMIPSSVSARFNIRYNPLHTGEGLQEHLKNLAQRMISLPHTLSIRQSGDAFLCPSPDLEKRLSQAIQQVVGALPEISTTGGTSDARFIKDLCPVIEFGLVNATAHQADEHISIEDLLQLEKIYYVFLGGL